MNLGINTDNHFIFSRVILKVLMFTSVSFWHAVMAKKNIINELILLYIIFLLNLIAIIYLT